MTKKKTSSESFVLFYFIEYSELFVYVFDSPVYLSSGCQFHYLGLGLFSDINLETK
jgi:hypothetical protein